MQLEQNFKLNIADPIKYLNVLLGYNSNFICLFNENQIILVLK